MTGGTSKEPHRSLWLEQALRSEETGRESPKARGDLTADIAIVGGGYVGLWSAIHIKRAEPSRTVVLLEGDLCGGGASGRNGGMMMNWWPKLPSLIKLIGESDAKRVAQDSEEAILEIQDFLREHRVDCEFQRTGWLWTATSEAQLGAWRGVVDATERLGKTLYQPVSAEEGRQRTGSPRVVGGVFDPTNAILQPALLARGLRRIALELGVEIFEKSKVVHFTRSVPVVVATEQATVRADKLILATNAWAAGIPELARYVCAMTSDMIATAPIPEELSRIGYTGSEGITDSQMMIDYYRPTPDGRIVFGKGGGAVAHSDRFGADFDRDERRARLVEEDFRTYYPQLEGVQVTHHWSGAIDRTQTSFPMFGRLGGRPHLIYAVGWSGNGVGPSYLGGKIAASLALESSDQWAHYPLIDQLPHKYPPDPIRYFGAKVVRSAVATKERAEMRGEHSPWWARQFAKLAPSTLEDKS